MADREETEQEKAEQERAVQEQVLIALVRYNLHPIENKEAAEFIVRLNTHQRNAIDEFIEVTKEHIHVAVQTLRECQWDSAEAISQSLADNNEPQEGVDQGISCSVVEPIRASNPFRVAPSKPTKQNSYRPSELVGENFLLRKALKRATNKAGEENLRHPKTLILDPVATIEHTASTTNSPSVRLFASPYTDKMWYTRFMRPWVNFKEEAIHQWTSELYVKTFEYLRTLFLAPNLFNTTIPVLITHPNRFALDFEDDVVSVVVSVMDFLLKTEEFRTWCEAVGCNMGEAKDEDIGNDECVWAPKYVIRCKTPKGDDETRLIGHVEFLGGKPGALSESYRLRHTARWGSLRCVVGKHPYVCR
jgi:hypothetical protein